MNMKHSLWNRIVVGKTIGFLIGGLVLLLMPLMGMPLDLKFAIGLWLFYIIMGAVTAFMGIFDRHPILKFKMPFWFSGIVIGLTMHLILILLSYDQWVLMMNQIDFMGLQSPFWALIDGSIIGLLMSWVEKKMAGEGPNLSLV